MNHGREIAVRFEEVSKSFHPAPLLENISFDVACGEAFCILGRSGTGKTILLKLLIGLLKPDRGRIFLNQKEITTLDSASLLRLRKSVGFLFQHAALFDSISVADNIAFSLRRHSGEREDRIREMVHRKLALVGLELYGNEMPCDLSPGLRKRAGLARALALDPAVLLIDDPSSGIDCSTACEIDRLLLDLKQNSKTTLVIVSDELERVRCISDRLAVLEGGHLVACGSADELEKRDKGLLRQFAPPEDL